MVYLRLPPSGLIDIDIIVYVRTEKRNLENFSTSSKIFRKARIIYAFAKISHISYFEIAVDTKLAVEPQPPHTMAYVLTETSAGYALLKASDKKIYKSSSLIQDLDSSDKVLKEFKIAAFSKFNSAANALEEANSIIEGKVSSQLEKLLEEIKRTRSRP